MSNEQSKANRRGVVKWFNDGKGYGFLTADDGIDVFVHFSAIAGDAKYKKLTEGDEVEFEAHRAPKGWKAENVVVLEHA
jgi:CspA family cold shock protein